MVREMRLDSIIDDFLASGRPTFPAGEIRTKADVFALLSSIPDPEIPVINIAELGILRSVEETEAGFLIEFTPTYSGCPAMGLIEMQIRAAMDAAGIRNYELRSVLSPAWTTDSMSEEAKRKLKDFGIAPPNVQKRMRQLFEGHGQVLCPRCDSSNTEMVSEFGSTACKSQFRCLDCREPFDYFKCH